MTVTRLESEMTIEEENHWIALFNLEEEERQEARLAAEAEKGVARAQARQIREYTGK
jgi:hypothetical protein